jgi:uncharacterized delta-60 repeat protein
MERRNFTRGSGVAVLVLACAQLTACGSGDEPVPPPPTTPTVPDPSPPGTLIGASGGVVNGPRGSRVTIPAGALTTETRILIEEVSTGAPALPAGYAVSGAAFALTPHGTTFAAPVTISLPFDPSSVPDNRTPQLFKTINSQTEWQTVDGATFGASSVSGAVTSFSIAQVVIPPTTQVRVYRSYSFRWLLGDGLDELEISFDDGEEPFDIEQEFGESFGDFAYARSLTGGSLLVPSDGLAMGLAASLNNGNTYWVGAEAPVGNIALDDDPVGSMTRLVQYQTFIKNAANASYTFTLTGIELDAFDGNEVLGRPCPPARDLYDGIFCDLIGAEVFLDVMAFPIDLATRVPGPSFYRISDGISLLGSSSIAGFGTFFVDIVTPDYTSFRPLFHGANGSTLAFDIRTEPFESTPSGHRSIRLIEPLVTNIDLSTVPVGQAFTVRVIAHARTYDRAAVTVSRIGSEFPTAAHAWLRDPASTSGTTVVTQGLTPVDTPIPVVDPVEAPVTPAPCTRNPAPDPEAGTIQFSQAAYVQAESATVSPITITRTGGTRGAVTATLTTTNESAIAGSDYTAINSSVFFDDGDDAARRVPVPLAQDAVGGEADKSLTLTLSQPGGCVAIGTQASAVLTIRDDDPAPPPPSGLDATFGSGGKATLEGFGGDRSGMAMQSDGKIVMVGGTFTDFVMARFNADGSIDSAFGNAGKVTTNMVPGEQEEALAVAIQPDGKIVVAGYTGQAVGPSVFALARYTADGEPDTSFGASGKVVTGVVGRGFALAITTSPDLKILVAGDDPAAEDFVLARYDANGALDPTFGSNGRVQTDIGAGDIAANLAILPDGRILASGGSSLSANSSKIARYLPNGTLDASFGNGGTLTLPGRVGEGLALQRDGKIVLAGNADGASAAATVFALMRLDADGGIDGGFGTAGLVTTPITTQSDAAFAVAIQADGKIVAAGRSSGQVNSNFAVARYLPGGALDPAFGNGSGFLTVDFFGFTDIAESVVIDRDGKIVAGGLARDNVDGYGVARLNP